MGVEIIIGTLLGGLLVELGHHDQHRHRGYYQPPPPPRVWCQMEHTGKYLLEYGTHEPYYVPEMKKVCYRSH